MTGTKRLNHVVVLMVTLSFEVGWLCSILAITNQNLQVFYLMRTNCRGFIVGGDTAMMVRFETMEPCIFIPTSNLTYVSDFTKLQ